MNTQYSSDFTARFLATLIGVIVLLIVGTLVTNFSAVEPAVIAKPVGEALPPDIPGPLPDPSGLETSVAAQHQFDGSSARNLSAVVQASIMCVSGLSIIGIAASRPGIYGRLA